MLDKNWSSHSVIHLSNSFIYLLFIDLAFITFYKYSSLKYKYTTLEMLLFLSGQFFLPCVKFVLSLGTFFVLFFCGYIWCKFGSYMNKRFSRHSMLSPYFVFLRYAAFSKISGASKIVIILCFRDISWSCKYKERFKPLALYFCFSNYTNSSLALLS